MQLVKCCTSNTVRECMDIWILTLKNQATWNRRWRSRKMNNTRMHSQVLAPWKPDRPGEGIHPHAQNEYLIPSAHNDLQLIETFIITRKPNFHQRIYKRQRHIEPYYDLFPSNSHLLVEDCLVILIWPTAHFCIGFPIYLFPWKSSTKILLYTLTMHETDSPRLILPYLSTTIT